TRLPNDETVIGRFFEPFRNNCKVAVEATGNWYWLVDLLQALNLDVSLVNPFQTKAIAYARVKTDKVDAWVLTHLLRTNFLATCWIPDKEQRANRDLLRTRLALVKIRTQCKNIVHGILEKFNIKLPFSNLWDGLGHEALEKISLSSPYSEFLKQLLAHIDLLTSQIDYWEEKIREQIPLSTKAQRLLAVPGIGNIWALTILYETGPIERFPCAQRYVAYAGLVPKTKGSGDKYRHGHLCKQANMYLKCAYLEVATASLRAYDINQKLFSYYQRILRRKGKGIAKVALARKIATIVYYMLRENIDYATCLARNRMAG
ncbi:MAG: IS110 family transposase, partial [candidate division WOR-3 bacterium]|nr:IS110 family transposase [candidate division WOR-3 bacterium]